MYIFLNRLVGSSKTPGIPGNPVTLVTKTKTRKVGKGQHLILMLPKSPRAVVHREGLLDYQNRVRHPASCWECKQMGPDPGSLNGQTGVRLPPLIVSGVTT